MARKIKNKKYHYFYRITNSLNNHFYYGIHSTNDLDDGYMGSGSRLKYAYKKYGIENFTKEILEFFNSREECAKYESEMVTEDLVHSKECYNISCGGEFFNTIGSASVINEKGDYFRCSIYDENFLNGNYKGVNYKKIVVFDKKESKYIRISTDEYYNNKNKYKIIGFPICVKRKDDLEGKYFNITLEEYLKNKDLYISRFKDYVHMKDKNNKYYYVHKSDDRIISGELIPMWSGWKHSEETKRKISESHKINKYQQGEKNSQYGTCWITKEGVNKKIKKEEIDLYIQEGWIKGRKIKK